MPGTETSPVLIDAFVAVNLFLYVGAIRRIPLSIVHQVALLDDDMKRKLLDSLVVKSSPLIAAAKVGQEVDEYSIPGQFGGAC